MKAFILALVAIVAIAFGATYTFDYIGWSTQDRTAGANVRP
jgi:hypothetical protein